MPPDVDLLVPLFGAPELLFSQVAARLRVPLALVDRALRIRFANARLCEHAGRPASEILGTRVDEIVVGISFDEDLQRYYDRCFAGESVADEAWMAYQEHHVRYVRVAFDPISDADKSVVYAMITLHDMTEQRQVEHANRRLEWALRAISQCNRIVSAASSEVQLADEACRIAVDVLGYRMAWIGVLEDGPGRRVRSVASAGDDKRYLDSVTVSWGSGPDGNGPTGKAIRRRHPVVAPNLLAEPGYRLWRNQALQRGFRSAAAFPLMSGKTVLGALSVYASEFDAFDRKAVELLQSLAEIIGFGIRAIRTRADCKQGRDRPSLTP